MRKSLAYAAAAVLAWSVAGSAGAVTIVVGGLAGKCSIDAKAGKSDFESIDNCSRALAAGPLSLHDRAGTFVNRGAMELLNRDYEAAHSDFQAALRLVPDMGEAHIGEGAVLIQHEQFADADREISRGLELGSEEPEKGYYFRGIARWGQNDFKGAYLDFTKASELKPSWSLPREQLAKFHVEPAH